MPAATFHRLAGFDEAVALGEDLDLVVRSRAAGVELVGLRAALVTSARRYRGKWLRTTLRHVMLTWMLAHQARRRARAAS